MPTTSAIQVPRPTVLPLRVSLPTARAGLVPRTALLRRLRASVDTSLVAVIAPAGYGKTTAVAQWAREDPRPFAWVSLGEESHDPAELLTYLTAALEKVLPIDHVVTAELHTPHPSARHRAAAGLAASVASTPRPFVLVVDDSQRLTGRENLRRMETLAAHLPPGCQIALVGRSEPGLPLARMRAEGSVLDIGVPQLRMGEHEAADLLAASDARMTRREIADLTAHTEGWPVGIYLAALARQAHDTSGPAPGPVTGDDRLIADYLRSQVLEGLPRELHLFLLRSAVLDELSGPLCDAVLERAGSASLLEELESANLFLVPLDRRRRWYRYARLFQELLQHELERVEPEAVPELARRASDYYAQEREIERAVHYAQLAEDVQRTGRLVAGIAMPWFANGRASTLGRWFDWLAQREPADPMLAVLGAWLSLLSGHPADADRWAAIAEKGSAERRLPDGSESIHAWRWTLKAGMSRNVTQLRQSAVTALELLGPASQWRPTAELLLGLSELLADDEKAADTRFVTAAEQGPEMGAMAAAAMALALRALISIRHGRWRDASAFTDRSLAVTREGHVEDYPTSALTFAVGARVSLHEGDIGGARTRAATAKALARSLTRGLAHIAAVTKLELARASLALGEVDDAERTLGEVNRLLTPAHGWGTLRSEADELTRAVKDVRANTPEIARLTPAELRLIPPLATQLSFREIAEQLFVSPHTVKHQAHSIYRKLGVTSRTAAIGQCRDIGLLPKQDGIPHWLG